jgi:hypothetical protein
MTVSITMRDAKRLYNYGNDHGAGYAPYTDVAGPDTIEAAVDAAVADGWTVILERYGSDQIVVLQDADGALLGIGGDAMGRGAWAVPLSDQVDALAAWDIAQASAEALS